MKISIKKRALLLGFIFTIFFLGSLVGIGLILSGNAFCVVPGNASATTRIADIYQNGELVRSITLDSASWGGTTDAYTISFLAPDGGTNIVEVRPGSIGILSADCPDRLCVKQGFISTSLLPITCLPHRLVIQIRQVSGSGSVDMLSPDPDLDSQSPGNSQPDMITY